MGRKKYKGKWEFVAVRHPLPKSVFTLHLEKREGEREGVMEKSEEMRAETSLAQTTSLLGPSIIISTNLFLSSLNSAEAHR